jgi:hypothetical protein
MVGQRSLQEGGPGFFFLEDPLQMNVTVTLVVVDA